MPEKPFSKIYWGKDNSTEVVFEANDQLPTKEQITSCFVFALHDDNVIMAKSVRGWGLPGGHREDEETAEECVRREANEEASITLTDLKLIGRWSAKKIFHSTHNEKYPDVGYQLLYIAKVKDLQQFQPQFETSERAIVPLTEIENYHHVASFREILDFVRSKLA